MGGQGFPLSQQSFLLMFLFSCIDVDIHNFCSDTFHMKMTVVQEAYGCQAGHQH